MLRRAKYKEMVEFLPSISARHYQNAEASLVLSPLEDTGEARCHAEKCLIDSCLMWPSAALSAKDIGKLSEVCVSSLTANLYSVVTDCSCSSQCQLYFLDSQCTFIFFLHSPSEFRPQSVISQKGAAGNYANHNISSLPGALLGQGRGT